MTQEPRGSVLKVEEVSVTYQTGYGRLVAAENVSFEIRPGETLSVVGESGSGKSSLARGLLGLEEHATGRVLLGDTDLLASTREDLRRQRPRIQMIFQDPIASLNPRLTVQEIVGEGLRIWPERAKGDSREEIVRNLLREVGLNPDAVWGRRAGEFSGGQAQRIGIARALAVEPEVLICDEAVSALDVSVQAQVLNLLRRLQRTHNLGVIFITHDLSVVRNISDQVLVMYLGRVAELAPADSFFARQAHPYSQLLLNSAPGSEGVLRTPSGEQPSPVRPPSGCVFRTRCPFATQKCIDERPPLIRSGDSLASCHYAGEVDMAAWMREEPTAGVTNPAAA